MANATEIMLEAAGYLDAVGIVAELGKSKTFTVDGVCVFCMASDKQININEPMQHKMSCLWARSNLLLQKWRNLANVSQA